MAKWWSLLFGVVIIACTMLFVISPFVGWWLPGGFSTHSGDVDFLFYIILWVTAFFFLLTEGLLVVFMFKFTARGDTSTAEGKHPPGMEFADRLSRPFKKYIPNEQRLELIWTAIPAFILLLLAVGQIPSWARIKYISQMPPLEQGKTVPLQIAVSARQFEWRMRYPSPETWKRWKDDPKLAKQWAINPEIDDVHVANELHVWGPAKDAPLEKYPAFVCHLSTIDVQHNLNIPHFRVKQDALPGKVIPVWFRPTQANTIHNTKKKLWEDGYRYGEAGPEKDRGYIWEIACAELCGRWHYHMVGRVYVHPTEEDWLAWLEQEAKKQNTTQRDDLGAK